MLWWCWPGSRVGRVNPKIHLREAFGLLASATTTNHELSENDSTMPKEEYVSVSDSTDWLTTPLACLASVESTLRCQVCKDFFTTPMITTCGHTFCSACIRKSLSQDGRCPACRAGDQEIKLKHNGTVEDAVEAFVNGRETVLRFAMSAPAQQSPETDPGEGIPRRGKRKADVVNGDDQSIPNKRATRSSAKRTPVVEQAIEIDDSHDDEEDREYAPIASPIDDGLVACPVCQGRMTVVQCDRHIDQCTGIPPRPPNSNTSPSRPGISRNGFTMTRPVKIPDRIPTINYGMVKDTMLRKKLAEHGLSTGGTRTIMEKRYSEWVLLVNSNCDAKRPRGKKDLTRDLETWERTQGSRAPAATGAGTQIKDKDFDAAAWNAKHGSNFKDLIASAKKNVSKSVAAKTTESETASGSSSCATEGSEPIIQDNDVDSKEVNDIGSNTQNLPTNPIEDTAKEEQQTMHQPVDV